MAACRYLEQGGTVESWLKYEIELEVPKSRTRKPRSIIQPFFRWSRGGQPDYGGHLFLLSSAFDAWLAHPKENRPDPTPQNGEPGTSQLSQWLRREHGYQAVGKAHNARLEYEAALKRGAVWVTHDNGTERVYDTKAAAESRNEGPIYEEPAEWWDLEGSEPVGVGEYRQIDLDTDEEDDDDPLPERIKGVVRPEYRHRPDDQIYSEANFETTATPRDRQKAVQMAAAHRLGGRRKAESRTRTPHGTAPRFEPEAPRLGNRTRLSPKCGKLAIPIGEPVSRYSERYRMPRSGERSYIEKVYMTPPPFFAALNSEFHFTPGFDPCPHPRPKGFDGLKVPWPECVYCNCPFRKQDSTDGHGIAAFARKAIEQNKLGTTVVLVLPTKGTITHLLDAGAEFRSVRPYLEKSGFTSGSRIPWIDPETGQPATTSPSSNMLAILWGKGNPNENEIRKLKARIAELEAEKAALKARTKKVKPR